MERSLKPAFLACLVLMIGVVAACKGVQNQAGPAAYPTPGWVADYTSRGWPVAPPAPVTRSSRVDPTGEFFEDELVIDFWDTVPPEKIAEILAGENLEVRWIAYLTRSFVVQVDPAQREAILEQLIADPNVSHAGRNKVFPEWIAEYTSRGWPVAPPAPVTRSSRIDPTGEFFEDELMINFGDTVPPEKIAEILAGENLEVRWIAYSTRSFVVQVDPAQREAILEQLIADPNVSHAGRNKVFPELIAEYSSRGWPVAFLAPYTMSTKIDPTGAFFEDELIINFEDSVPADKIAEILAEKGLKVKWISYYSRSFVVQVDPARREAVLEQLIGDPNVEYAERDYVVRPLGGR